MKRLYRLRATKRAWIGVVLFVGVGLSLWITYQRADSGATLDTAQKALLRGDYAEAVEAYETLAAAAGPGQIPAREALLRCLLTTGQYDRAKDLAKKFLSESPGRSEWHYFIARAAAYRGLYPEALRSFESSLASTSSLRDEAEIQRALLLRKTGQLDESRQAFATAYDRLSEDESKSGLAAICLQNLERYKEANRLFKKATMRDPQDYQTWIAWGYLFLEKYNPAEAASVFKDVLTQNPRHPEALLGMALCRGEGAGEEVESMLQRVLEVNANLEGAHAARARFALQAEAFDVARESIALCFKVNPNSLEAHSLQAVLAYAQGQDEEMKRSIRSVLDINPHFGEVYESLGHFCVTQRLYREALNYFRKAVDIDPKLWRARAALGVNLLRVGEEAAAKQELDVAFESDPYNVWTFNTLKLIDSYANFESSQIDGFQLRLHKKEVRLLINYVPAVLDEAYKTLSAKYQFSPSKPIYFEMFPDHEDFAVRTLGVPGLGALGVCFGQGVVMDSPSARSKGSFNWGSTLWHEFTHVVTLQATENRVPRWFTEGLSVMEEHHARPGWGDDVNLEVVRAIQEKKLLPISELNGGFLRPKFPGQVQLSYFQAGQACEFIQRQFGFNTILKMLGLFKERQPLATVLKEALGLTPGEFDKDFNGFLDAEYGQVVKNVDFSFLENKGLSENRQKLESFVASNPDNFFANLKLARYYRQEGNRDLAIKYFDEAKSLFPGYVHPDNPYKQLSEIYKEQGMTSEAIRELTQLTAIHDSDFDSLKQLATWLKESGRTQDAREVLERAMFVYPFDAETHQMLADLAQAADDHQVALREYRALLALDPPDKASAHLNLAQVLFDMGQRSEAKKEVLAALEIAPGFEPAQELLLKTIKSFP